MAMFSSCSPLVAAEKLSLKLNYLLLKVLWYKVAHLFVWCFMNWLFQGCHV